MVGRLIGCRNVIGGADVRRVFRLFTDGGFTQTVKNVAGEDRGALCEVKGGFGTSYRTCEIKV